MGKLAWFLVNGTHKLLEHSNAASATTELGSNGQCACVAGEAGRMKRNNNPHCLCTPFSELAGSKPDFSFIRFFFEAFSAFKTKGIHSNFCLDTGILQRWTLLRRR